MKISIVTISYNQGRFLDKAIRSVIEQDYPEVEYIVVDPGSTDNSREIIARHPSSFAKTILEPDNGPADGLNKGFSYASGDIYGYLNADDLYLPGAFRKVAEYFRKNPSVDVVNAHGYVIDENDKIEQKFFSRGFDVKRYLCGLSIQVQQSTFFRPGIFRKVGGFNPRTRVAWDGELHFHFGMANAKFAIVHDYWGAFRVHGESITGSQDAAGKYARELARLRSEAGFSEVGRFERRALWLTGWLKEPRTLLMRIADGVAQPQRVL
jgi:glycosyltransferase involved in cell wall biosynthesis